MSVCNVVLLEGLIMVQHVDLQTVFAQRYPHVAQIADDLEAALTIIQATNKGYGEVKFTAQGIDIDGHLEIKYIDSQIRRFRKKKTS